MRSSGLYVLAVVVLASTVAIGTGCNNDTLNSGSQNLSMTYTPSPSGAGRFDTATLIISRLEALPADPTEAAIYGSERLLFQFNPYTAHLTLTQPTPYTTIALSAGTYRATFIELSPLALVDTASSPSPVCIDGIAVLDGSQPPGIPSKFAFAYPPGTSSPANLTFTIQPGQTSLALTVDVPGLIAGYEAAYTCQFVQCPGCPVDPSPTLTAFDQTAYRDALLANIKIQ
jgi:hypothetical protein